LLNAVSFTALEVIFLGDGFRSLSDWVLLGQVLMGMPQLQELDIIGACLFSFG
jgi:hypothetical protein